MREYLPIIFFMFLGALIGAGSILAGLLVGFCSPNSLRKLMAYECGAVSFGSARIQFKVGYYLFALLFLVFDIESLFLFPCMKIFRATAEGRVPEVAYGVLLIELGVFIAILLVGLVYAWRKGALKWE